MLVIEPSHALLHIRQSSFVFHFGRVGQVVAHAVEEDFDWAPLARTGQPIVLYMVMHSLERIAAALMQAGLAGTTPAAVIASATTPQERILISTLEKVAADGREQKFEPPAIVVIGDIVNAREQLLGQGRA